MSRHTLLTVALAVALAAALPAHAQLASKPGGPPAPVAVEGQDPALQAMGEEPAWGTSDYTMINMGAAAFIPMYGDTTWAYYGLGYIYRTGGSYHFWAPASVPSVPLPCRALGSWEVLVHLVCAKTSEGAH